MWLYLVLCIAALLLLFFLFRKTTNASFAILFLLSGIILGTFVTFWFLKKSQQQPQTTIDVTTVAERIEKVCKVVTAEGHFSEVYNYENTEHLLAFIPSTKKALLMANAKVLMGFDFKKIKWELDQKQGVLRVLEFPEPEILALEPDLHYYNLENGLFNKFNAKDITSLQADAQGKLKVAALKSNLPATAREQMKLMLVEIAASLHLKLEGQEKISPNATIKNLSE